MERSQGDERKKLALNWLLGLATIVITARYLHFGQVMLFWVWVHFITIRYSGKGRYLKGALVSAILSFAAVFVVYALLAPVFYIHLVVVISVTTAGMMLPALVANWFYQRYHIDEARS